VEQKRHIQTQVQFQYDALGLRIQKEVIQRSVRTGEITSHYKHDYLWMGDVILEDRCTELLDNSHPAKQAVNTDKVVSIGANNNADTGELASNAGVILYLHEPSAFRPMAQIRSEQTGEGEQTESIYYYHPNHIGTPLELTDEQGRIVWKANYSGFGQARIINSGITNLIRYPGQYEDSEIGIHYNRFRYYDPSSGQYTQQDPIGLMGGEQLSQYVADPVKWVDVLGLQGDCPKYTNKDADGLIKGHSGEHVPRKGASDAEVRALSQSRPRKQNTTVYRNRKQAQQDLRNALNQHVEDIANLKPGEQFRMRTKTQKIRNGYNFKRGGDPESVSCEEVTIALEKRADGGIDILHYSPRI
jgi:RHS repeat-associated protein